MAFIIRKIIKKSFFINQILLINWLIRNFIVFILLKIFNIKIINKNYLIKKIVLINFISKSQINLKIFYQKLHKI